MFERFTESARLVVIEAQAQAKEFSHPYMGTEHLLLGLLNVDGEPKEALNTLGLTFEKVTEIIKKIRPPFSSKINGHMPFSDNAKKVLEMSVREALRMGQTHVNSTHILQGLIRVENSTGYQIVTEENIDFDALGEILRGPVLTGASPISGDNSRVNKKNEGHLEKVAVNLNQRATDNLIDPVIGREKEIKRVIEILARRGKNNPILIGEAGVGKTAIAEGIAQKIVNKEVPKIIANKEIYSLDIGALIAGTRYRGDFEERIKNVLNEVQKRKDIILFIDEIHTLVGAGGGDSALDAANILKPMLARGELQVIGATTYDEWRKYIEKDAALARRMQQVKVDEPGMDTTTEILRGLRNKYEEFHKVTFTDEALELAVRYAKRYITDKHLPDTAIDIIDEAGARAAVNSEDDSVTVITPELIREIISDIKGVPVNQLSDAESSRLADMELTLNQRVIGQPSAISALSRSVRRSRAGLSDPNRPNGSFIFAGPTGVGKTECARALAAYLFGDESNLITLDMSEYAEKHTVSKMYGSPPGYVGHDEGGQLTEAVRRNPYSVVLFDEIEKAHPDVFNALLQILEEGRLTDSSGRVVDFKNTVIILTTNIGSDQLKQNSVGFAQFADNDRSVTIVKKALKDHMKPEFLNRLDEIIIFNSLVEKDVEKIAKIFTAKLENLLKVQGISISINEEVIKDIAEKGYDSSLGARPLRRTIQTSLEDPLAEMIVAGSLSKGSHVTVEMKNGKINFEINSDETLQLTEKSTTSF